MTEPKKFTKPSFLSEKQFSEHIKLYEGYVKKSDAVKEKFASVNWDDANTTLSEVRSLILGETFANNGLRLHECYFENIGKSEFKGKIKDKILEKFKTLEEFRKRFEAFGISSRGWTMLAWDNERNGLRLFGTDKHDDAVWNCVPLLVLDVYEHAYFLDYGTDRKRYIEDFFNNINWSIVNKRLAAI